MKVSIYTDGSSKGNPGCGGYGVVLLYEGHRKEVSEGFRLTTNNRMELLAVIVGLEALKSFNKNIVIYSDSKYVVNAIEKKWLFNWEKKPVFAYIILESLLLYVSFKTIFLN